MFALIDETGFKVLFTMIMVLLFLGISPIKEDKLERSGEIFVAKVRRMLMVFSTALMLLMTALLWYFFDGKDIGIGEYLMYKLNQNKWPLIITIVLTLIAKVAYYRYGKVIISNMKKRFNVSVGTEKLSDIKDTLGKYLAPKYNPEHYFDLNKGIFVGLNSQEKITSKTKQEFKQRNKFNPKVNLEPIYIPIDEFKECHKEIIGASRSGKGVAACYLAMQKIKLGWGVFYIDPKPDKFVPRVLYKACKKMGKRLYIIDLVEGKAGQYAPFRGGTLKDIKARTKQVFKIRRSGGDADYYKGQEINMVDDTFNTSNRGVQQIYDDFVNKRMKKNKESKRDEPPSGIEDVFKELVDIIQIQTSNGAKPKKEKTYKYATRYDKEQVENFLEKEKAKKNKDTDLDKKDTDDNNKSDDPLSDEAILYPAQAEHRHTGGLSISRAIMENYVVYIRGDTVDVNIRTLIKLVLTEITQEVKRLYPYRGDENHVSIDMDEGKFVMSEILSDSMATIAAFACDMTVQYQALEDIETSIEKDIDMKALAAALHINTQIKLIHGGMAPRTAEYLEEQTGTVIKKITAMDKVSVKELGAEQWDGQKMMRDQEEALLTQNDFLSMGKLTFALLERGKLAKIVYSSFIDVQDQPRYLEILKG